MKSYSPAGGINSDQYNVLAYGAKGDDANADHVALQAAMDDAWRAGGGEVVVPEGIYRMYQHPLRMRERVRLTLRQGAEIHSYHDGSSMFWNGDGSQNRAGYSGHGNLTITGGVFDMRRSASTHGCTNQVTGGTDAPSAGTSQSWTVVNNSASSNRGFPPVPFYVYDPAAPTETMMVTAVSGTTSTNLTWTVTRGAKSTTPVAHSASFTIRNADMSLSYDSFTRSNTSAPHTLGVMDSGQTWTDETSRGSGDQGSGGIGITSNTASAAVAGTNISTVPAWPDGEVEAALSTAGNAGVVFRCKDSQNFWQYVRHTDNNARLSYWVNGVETVVSPTATQAVSGGDTLRVVFFGDRVRAYVGATLTHDATVAVGTTWRKVGIMILDTTARVDNFISSASLWADSFTRSNSSSSLGTSSSNIGWTSRSGTLGISSNAAYAPGAGTNISTVPTTQDTNVEAIMTVAGNAGLIFRYKDSSNYMYYVRHTDGNARMGKVVAGVDTVITPAATQAVGANSLMRVTMNGGHIRGYIGSVLTHDTGTTTTWESFNYQEKNVGIVIYDTTARLGRFDSVVAWGGSVSGACFNFGHAEGIIFRDTTIRDVSAVSHAVEVTGCKNVLADNCTFPSHAPVYGRWSEAWQMDITKGTSYFAAFGPHDNTTNRDVVVRGCSFTRSGAPGTSAWARGVGSHSSTIGVWHDHLRVVDNFFDCSEKSVRAYNWNNVFIRGNTVLGGTGLEVRTVDTADAADTINLAGTTTNASQGTYSTEIEGNIVTMDNSTDGNVAGINVTGLASGQPNGVIVRGNDIRSTTSGGIHIDQSANVMVSSNMVNSQMVTDSGTNHGIRINGCSDVVVVGNGCYRIGRNGIYVTGGSTKVRVLDNYVRGANRKGGSDSAYKIDSGSVADVTFSGNSAQIWGSSPEFQYGLHVSAGTNVRVLKNDWDVGSLGDVSMTAASNVMAEAFNGAIVTITGTSETSAINLTIPANQAKVGQTYKLVAGGYVSRAASASVTTTKVTCGAAATGAASVVSVAPASSSSSSSNIPFYIEGQFQIVAIGASGAMRGVISITQNAAQGLLNATTGNMAIAVSTSNITVDTTADRVLSLTFTNNASGPTTVVANASITRVN